MLKLVGRLRYWLRFRNAEADLRGLPVIAIGNDCSGRRATWIDPFTALRCE